jgi:predicted 2-oxoglutarate/Fe(II)-dependent dioxygenase YbiX
MIGERTENALARIRAALSRIEAAGDAAAHAARAAEASATEQARQHEALRAAVAETLRDLDLLIGQDDRA